MPPEEQQDDSTHQNVGTVESLLGTLRRISDLLLVQRIHVRAKDAEMPPDPERHKWSDDQETKDDAREGAQR